MDADQYPPEGFLVHHSTLAVQGGKELTEHLRIMMDAVDSSVFNKPLVMGRYWSSDAEKWIIIPAGADTVPPLMLKCAQEISAKFLHFPRLGGIRYGTGCAKVPAMPMCKYGVLFS